MGCAASIQPQDNYVFRFADESDKKQNSDTTLQMRFIHFQYNTSASL